MDRPVHGPGIRGLTIAVILGIRSELHMLAANIVTDVCGRHISPQTTAVITPRDSFSRSPSNSSRFVAAQAAQPTSYGFSHSQPIAIEAGRADEQIESLWCRVLDTKSGCPRMVAPDWLADLGRFGLSRPVPSRPDACQSARRALGFASAVRAVSRLTLVFRPLVPEGDYQDLTKELDILKYADTAVFAGSPRLAQRGFWIVR
ncbi:hypothetical protein OPT61_g76 [Boeremia exigua]|uniref:Uncharacterized protein n=1 Tax=Boeremia exigua TaxID=749465 RepID=A0ACC2IVB6_9PLEO|nr:hypothetical protein OPT61_g76 [Boeremia exigua]